MAYMDDEVDLGDELCRACRSSDEDESDALARVRELLAEGAPVNSTQSSDGYSALGLAAEWSPAIVEELIKAGADARVGDMHDGSAPLVYAAMGGNVECAALLLAHGADPDGLLNGRRQGDTPPLHCAVFSGDGSIRITKLLLEAGANPNAPKTAPDWVNDQSEGETALHRAARLKNGPEAGALCALLMEHGADHQARDKIGRTPLHSCAEHGSEQAASVLLDFGADQCARDDHGFTPAGRARLQHNEKTQGILAAAEERSEMAGAARPAALGKRGRI